MKAGGQLHRNCPVSFGVDDRGWIFVAVVFFIMQRGKQYICSHSPNHPIFISVEIHIIPAAAPAIFLSSQDQFKGEIVYRNSDHGYLITLRLKHKKSE